MVSVPLPLTCELVTLIDSITSFVEVFITLITPDPTFTAYEKTIFSFCNMLTPVELSAGSKVEIKPIFAEDSQIPIRNRRTNSNMILVGTDIPQNFLIKGLKKNEDIVPGDKLVTSGLGKKYPKGIDVGIVNKISATSNNEFLEIQVLGTSEFSSGDQILLTLP